MKQDMKVKNLVIAALFAALICIATGFLPRIPTGFNGGYIHLGDIFIYLGASLLPAGLAVVASSLGAGLADALTGGMVWVVPTIIIKGIMVLFFTSKQSEIICKRNIVAIFLAGIFGCLGYYIASAIMAGNFVAPLSSLMFEVFQPLVSGIIYLIIGKYFDKVNIKSKILK